MRSYLAELLGAFFLVFTVLSTSAVAPVIAAAAVGGVLTACVWIGAQVSGAHFNPAVTLAVYLRGGLSLLDLWSYWAAQLAGALIASMLALAIPFSGGDLDVSGRSTVVPALVVEFLFTFALVSVVLAFSASPGPKSRDRTTSRPERYVVYGVAVGVVVLAGMLTVSAVSGAAFNPAVAFGLAVDGEFAWAAIWVYVSAELVAGAAAAAFVSRTRPLPAEPARLQG